MAEKLVRKVADVAEIMAERAVGGIIEELRSLGHQVVASGIVLGGHPLASTLTQTLSSHAAMHAAEGEMYRQALIHASETCGLPLRTVRERELYEHGAAALGIPVDELRGQVAELGRAMGPPWGQDQKGAALAAWLALAAFSSSTH